MSDESTPPVEIPPSNFVLSESAYAKAKWLVQIVMPALGTFYGTVSLALDIDKTGLVLTIWGALILLLGTIMGLSSRNYNASDDRFDGQMTVIRGSDRARELGNKKQVVFKVNKVDELPGSDS